jgi:hypothetical protein
MQLTADAQRRMEKAKKYLRIFLMDTPDLNRLIRAEESDADMITFGIDMEISDWNSSAPLLTSVDISNFPSLFLLLHGAAVQILKSQGLHQARNQLTYNSGGSSFMRSDKSALYQSWMVNFSNEYELKKRNMKISQNISAGYGGVYSEYNRLGYSW